MQEIEKELREDANKKLCLIDSTSNFPTEILSLPYIGVIMLIQTSRVNKSEKRFYSTTTTTTTTNNNNNKELVKLYEASMWE